MIDQTTEPLTGLERPLPRPESLKPPKLAVIGVAGAAVLMFGYSLIQTSDLQFLQGGGDAEAAEVPAAEPIEAVARAQPVAETETPAAEEEEEEVAEEAAELQTASVETPAPEPEATAPTAPEAELQPIALQAEPLEVTTPAPTPAAAETETPAPTPATDAGPAGAEG